MLTRKIYDEIKIWIPIHKAYKEFIKYCRAYNLLL